MNNASGWIFIKNNKFTKHINSKLPPLILDPEALVRRAVLDAMACLIHNQSYEGLFDIQGLRYGIERVYYEKKQTISNAICLPARWICPRSWTIQIGRSDCGCATYYINYGRRRYRCEKEVKRDSHMKKNKKIISMPLVETIYFCYR